MTGILCWLTRRRLGAYQDGELAPAVRAKTAAHLATCARCATELAGLGRLREAIVANVPQPPEAVWQAFWPQVRARLAADPAPEPRSRAAWEGTLTRPRLAFGSGLAVVALAVIAALGPWQKAPERVAGPAVPGQAVPSEGGLAPAAQQVVVQSVEMADPGSSAMVFTNADSDVTIVWVFGLENTEI